MPQRELRFLAWGLLLLQAGVLAYGFTRVLLGTVALAEHLGRGGERRGFAGPFWATMAVLAGLYLYALYRLEGVDPGVLHDRARQSVRWANPCKPDLAALEKLHSGAREEVAATRAAAKAEADQAIEARLDAVFGEAEAGVDRYLDWYFTVLGEYQRIGALAAGELDEMMMDALERHLFGDGMLGERLERASVEIGRASEARMAAVATRLGINTEVRVREQPCGLGALDLGTLAAAPRDVARASTAAGAGLLVGGVAVRSLARGAVKTAATRAASRSTFRVASGLLGRQAVKRGGTWGFAAGAAAACAPGGPLAIVCGLVAGAVSWLALDKALITLDEALFRDAMKKDILETLAEQRRALEEKLRVQHHATIDQMAAALDGSLERMFVPAREA